MGINLKVWVFSENFVDEDVRKKNSSFLLSSVLESRGLKSEEEINDFLNFRYEISDSSKFFGISSLINRLNIAIEKFEKICVFGDYDCDGITATVMLYSYLLKKNSNVIYMLPSRYDEGYGLTKSIVDKMLQHGVNLIITVDNGISAYDEIEYARNLGIDVIVTDHHKIPEKLPPAVSIVNPHLNESGFKDFAGVGVVFKIIQELEKDNSSLDGLIEEYGDLLSIGTIGDMVPLLEENRMLVSKSLEYLAKTKRFGVKLLLEGSLFSPKMDGIEVSFGVVPKLNACGRMGSAEIAAQLLLSTSIDEARSLLQIALKMNEERKSMCKSIFEEVEKEIFKKNLDNDRVIFAWSKNWSHGVIGIAAAVISAKFGKPCFLFSIQKDEVRGSARSIEGFDIHDCLAQCKDLLTKYGGHPLAAGANLKIENLEKFREKFLSIVNNLDMPFAKIKIDCVINPEDVSLKSLDEIQKLAPFGSGNPEPIFGILRIRLLKVTPIGGGKHIRILFSKDDKKFNATMFGVSSAEFLFSSNYDLDLAIRMKRNYFSGYEDVAVHLVDVKYSDVDTKELALEQRIFEDFMSGVNEIPDNSIPKREDFVAIFKTIKENSLFSFRIEELYMMIRDSKMRLSKIYLILEIFRELEIFKIKKHCNNYKISIQSTKKVNLNESEIFKKSLRRKHEQNTR